MSQKSAHQFTRSDSIALFEFHLQAAVGEFECATLLRKRRRGVCLGHTDLVKEGPSGWDRSRYQKPYASDPAATLSIT
eukprot:3625898-Pyramimonas_sp.AAC.1